MLFGRKVIGLNVIGLPKKLLLSTVASRNMPTPTPSVATTVLHKGILNRKYVHPIRKVELCAVARVNKRERVSNEAFLASDIFG